MNKKVNDAFMSVLKPSRELMSILYKKLNDEYDYLNSSEAIIEHIKSNEYDFTENGTLH